MRKKLENIAITQLTEYNRKGTGSGVSAIIGADTADTCEIKFKIPKLDDWNCVGNRVLFVTYMMLRSMLLPTLQRTIKRGIKAITLNNSRYMIEPAQAVIRDIITDFFKPVFFKTYPEIR